MADAFALPIRKLEDQDVDPATFTLIVTALSGLSAFLSIGQTGFQFSRSNKKVKEVVENEYFLDVTTIDKRETRNDVKAILDKLRKSRHMPTTRSRLCRGTSWRVSSCTAFLGWFWCSP